MSILSDPLAILTGIVRDLHRAWRPLLFTHLLYSLLTVALLAPLTGLALGVLVALSGEVALTDADILRFVLHPLGLLALVLGTALLISLVALRYAALMSVALWVRDGRHPRVLDGLGSALLKAPLVLRLAARMVAWTLIYAAPFLVAAALVAALLLGRYDINFYLAERPPAFWLAAVLLAVLGLGLGGVLLRLFVSWVHALPLVLFGQRVPARALGLSRRLSWNRQRAIAGYLLAWFALASAVTGLMLGLTDTLGEWVVALAGNALGLLATLLVGVILLGGVLSLLAGFINSALLSLLVVHLTEARLGHRLTPPPLGNTDPGWALRRQHLSLRAVLWGIVALGIVALLGGMVLLETVILTDETEIIAHRGASAVAPENTLAAMEQAIADGAHWVEIDVQEIADGTVVVFHDRDFKKAAGLDLAIHQATLADLDDIDIGSRLAPRFADQRVPTLDEVLTLARDRVGVLIELKYYGFEARLEERVVARVEAAGMVDQVRIMSLKPAGLAKIRQLRPDWTVGLLSSVAVGEVSDLAVDFLAVNARFIGPRLIRRIHRRDKTLMAWTVNDPLAMSELISQGVDGLITDLPALAAQVLAERAALNPVERLLLRLAAWSGRAPVHAPQ